MTDSMRELHIEALIDICADQTSTRFQAGWVELIRRYKNYIALIVNKRFNSWNSYHRQVDLSDITNDIINDTFLVLYQEKCSALKKFQARDSEKAFCAYIATIADRLAIRCFKKQLKNGMIYSTEGIHEKEASDEHKLWQVYDHIVSTLRRKAGKKQKFAERDILIFNLHLIEDFSSEMIYNTAIFSSIGHRVLDNAVIRCKEKLDQEDESILREIAD